MKTKKLAKIPLRVRLTNRWATFECSPEVQEGLHKVFSYQIPGARFSPRYGAGWDGRRHFLSRGRIPSGLFLDMATCAFREPGESSWKAVLQGEEAIYDVSVRDECTPCRFHPKENSELRPYQQKALLEMIDASGCGGIVLAATGSGKTRLAAAFFKRLLGYGVFVVDELSLLEQARRELSAVLDEEVGIVGNSKFDPQRITVATIQTIHRHRHNPVFCAWFRKGIAALIIDELHVQLNKRNLDSLKAIKPRAAFGLTATLSLHKPEVRMSAAALTGPVIFQYDYQQGVREGYLEDSIVISVRFHDPLKGMAPGYYLLQPNTPFRRDARVKIDPGSPTAEYRFHIALNSRRNDVVEALAREGVRRGRRVVVLVERKNHLYLLSRRLRDLKHVALCGDQKQSDRLAAMKAMDAGKLPLIIASRIFGRGVDIRTLDTVIDATGKPGAEGAQQRRGRGARRAAGKRGLLYLDVTDVGNTFAGAARSRLKVLEETGSRIVTTTWKGDACAVYDKARLV